eukprot:TRINITY_DN61088_c0_g1_i1.p1 TRINITY_DN61088_c0_g1~~TRINITY_DN61088_c0_g1_i1.p1  ORF type:complete len:265 (-),score=29.69 TRINITY_DN61088_c0_g1_i1:80-874(-)
MATDVALQNGSASAPMLLSSTNWRLKRGDDDEVEEPEEDLENAPTFSARHELPTLRGKKSPGPGDYDWNPDVNLNRPPVWSMSSPERKNMDPLSPTWTPLPSTNQSRAPPPTEYSNIDYNNAVSYHGKLGAPKWSIGLPAKEPRPGRKPLLTRHLSMVGGQHPAKPMPPIWTMRSPDRGNLPNDTPTWQPRMSTDLRPGPGQYDTRQRMRSKWKPTTRLGCTFGGRPRNMPTGVTSWTPITHGSNPPSSEHLRLPDKSVYSKQR